MVPEIRSLVLHPSGNTACCSESFAKDILGSSFLDWARKENHIVAEPLKGDIIVKKPAKHVGLMLTEPVASSFCSVEGNTWVGNKEKEGVYVVRRLHVINYEFVRVLR